MPLASWSSAQAATAALAASVPISAGERSPPARSANAPSSSGTSGTSQISNQFPGSDASTETSESERDVDSKLEMNGAASNSAAATGTARNRTPLNSANGQPQPTRRNAISTAPNHSRPNVITSQLLVMNSAANTAPDSTRCTGFRSHQRHVSGVWPWNVVIAIAIAIIEIGRARTWAWRSPRSIEKAGNSVIGRGSTRVASHHHHQPCSNGVSLSIRMPAMSRWLDSGATQRNASTPLIPAIQTGARRLIGLSASTSPARPNIAAPASAPIIAIPRLKPISGPLPESWPTASVVR